MHSTNDPQILPLFQENKSLAIASLREKYGRICLRILKNALEDRWLAEECCNALFDSITLTQLEQASSPLSACCSASRQYALQLYQAQHIPCTSLPLLLEELDAIAGHFAPNVNLVPEQDSHHLTQMFLSDLSCTEKLIFVERYYFLNSIADISQQYAMSQHQIHRCLRRLRRKLVLSGSRHFPDISSSADLFSLLGDLDEDHILLVLQGKDRFRAKQVHFRRAAVISCFLIAVCLLLGFVAVLLSGMGSKNEPLYEYTTSWYTAPVYARYYKITCDATTYTTNGQIISSDDLDLELEQTQASGWMKTIFAQKQAFCDAAIYQIAQVSPAYAVAVRYDNQGDYYLAVNNAYRPETLGQLTEDLNLRGTMVLNYIAHPVQTTTQNTHYDYLDDTPVWDFLRSAKNSTTATLDILDTTSSILWISVNLPWLNQNRAVFYVFEDSLVADLTGSSVRFSIDANLVSSFADSILAQCTLQ